MTRVNALMIESQSIAMDIGVTIVSGLKKKDRLSAASLKKAIGNTGYLVQVVISFIRRGNSFWQ